MKKFFTMLMVGLFVLTFTDCSAGKKNDIVIQWDNLKDDASFKQFKKATKVCQIENLNSLMSRANEEYFKLKTLDDLYSLREKVAIIKFYNQNADQKSVTVTSAIRELERKLDDVEAKFKKATILHNAVRDNYLDRGQDVDDE